MSNHKVRVGDQVEANVAEVEGMVGEVTRSYTEDGVDMVEVTYDEPVYDDDNTLDVEVGAVTRI
jgi:hypothetical protein